MLANAIPWVLTVLSMAVGIWQFADQRAQENKQPFLTRQLDLCFEASETVAKLATETDPVEWEKARKTFWQLYWGPLGVVEDREVEAAMVTLGRIVPKEGTMPQLPMHELEQPSLQLAHAARDLILESWRVDLPPLAGQTQ